MSVPAAQVYANTPDSVFQALAYLRELLLFLHHNYVVPALAYVSELLQRAWLHLQDSCKSVPEASARPNTSLVLRFCSEQP